MPMSHPPRTTEQGIKGLSGHRHWHACEQCHFQYQDACDDVEADGLCETCRFDRPRAWDWNGDADPRPCCGRAQQVDGNAQRLQWRLAGIGPWFRCPTCSRRFGHVHPRRRIEHPCRECSRTEFHVH